MPAARPAVVHSAAFHLLSAPASHHTTYEEYSVSRPPRTNPNPPPIGAPAEKAANAVARDLPSKLAAMIPIPLGVLLVSESSESANLRHGRAATGQSARDDQSCSAGEERPDEHPHGIPCDAAEKDEFAAVDIGKASGYE